ncbi:MAG: RluA family pseudouridine synthase [Dorea sp.]|nr:RluA family pseudouridine synthase [Dorea sp.]
MREIIIKSNEAGQRFDKFLKKYLNEAPTSFIYKMLRKKNITLNGKKADGTEKLVKDDSVKLFLADETIDKFMKVSAPVQVKAGRSGEKKKIIKPIAKSDIIFENAHVILMNKPAGILSQKADPKDISMNERMIAYLLESGSIKEEELHTFRPSICNRLDRNTSGLLAGGKSMTGSQNLSKLFHDRTVGKFYLCIVKGRITSKMRIEGYLLKDEKTNKVRITKDQTDPDASAIKTEYEPIAWNQEMTLLRVHLITGKTHQIRAHLASEGHFLAGDSKYGNRAFNEYFLSRFGLKHQLLHAYELSFPVLSREFADISEQSFFAAVPDQFWKIIKETKWQHGIQEALEVQH